MTLTKNEARLVAVLLRRWAEEAETSAEDDGTPFEHERPEWFPQNEWDALGLKLSDYSLNEQNQKVLTDSAVMEWAADVLSPKEVQS